MRHPATRIALIMGVSESGKSAMGRTAEQPAGPLLRSGAAGEPAGTLEEPEAGFDTLVQRTSYWKYNHTYIRARDSRIWHLLPENSGWEVMAR